MSTVAKALPALLLASCTATDPAPSRPSAAAPDAAAPATVVAEQEPPPVDRPEGPEYFLAVASQDGVQHCPDGYTEQWANVHPTLGWVPVGGAPAEQLDGLMGKAVLARGQAGPAPQRPLPEGELKLCPIMQMRSDWVLTPRGVRLDRGHRVGIDYFELSSVRPLDELSVRREGEELVARFENPLPFALPKLRLRMHYEGCYGKPGTDSIEGAYARKLEPGEAVEERFPIIAERRHRGNRKGGPPARLHLANSLIVEIAEAHSPEGGAVYSDLDVRLRELGVELECPKGRK